MERVQSSKSGLLPWWLVLMFTGLVFPLTGVADAGLGASSPVAVNSPGVISPAPMAMKSTADRMISYRHQNHMWQTSDGATHLMINQGTVSGNNSLRLFSSYDGGVTWTGGISLTDSNATSTSDGDIFQDRLYLTWSTPEQTVKFAVLQYRATLHNWLLLKSETAFSSPTITAINPALAADALGRIWLAFVSRTSPGGNYDIKLLSNASASQGWTDTGLTFGATDNISIERSARPVMTSDGVGMIYTVHEDLYWASRTNDAAIDQPWVSQLLFTSQANDNDPYESHFSLVADAQQNIHLVRVDGGRLLYFRFNASTQIWHWRPITNDISAGYPQITVVGGNLMIASNVNSQAGIYLSSDSGTTFVYTQQLIHGAPGPGVSYAYPRIETPGISRNPVPLVQQYSNGLTQLLLFYSVPGT